MERKGHSLESLWTMGYWVQLRVGTFPETFHVGGISKAILCAVTVIPIVPVSRLSQRTTSKDLMWETVSRYPTTTGIEQSGKTLGQTILPLLLINITIDQVS